MIMTVLSKHASQLHKMGRQSAEYVACDAAHRMPHTPLIDETSCASKDAHFDKAVVIRPQVLMMTAVTKYASPLAQDVPYNATE